MPNNVNEEIQKFINEVKKILGDRLKKVILYGSYARGDYNKKSDVDIMILTDLSFEEIEEYRDKISDAAFEIELKTGIILSPVVKNIEKYNVRRKFVPFYKNVEKEGVVLVNG
jgi:hypothetical protein